MEESRTDRGISFIRPQGTAMRGEVRGIRLVLASWFCTIIGFHVFIYLLEINYSELLLNEMTFCNLPIHFWLTGQLLPLWFIILCVLFNVWMDRHEASRLDGSLRFRSRSGQEED
jgi:putative solute:sodium symporter small subunit